MKLLAFAASSSTNSINKQVVGYATRLLADGLVDDVTLESIETIDLNDYEMPIYSADRESDSGIPPQAHDFFTKIGEVDAVLVSFAEHNGHYTAAYKNLLDWTSRIDMKVYQGKPAVLLAASPGPGGAANALNAAVASGPFFGYDVQASLSIPSFYDNFDVAAGTLGDADLDDEFRSALGGLATTMTATAS